MKDENIFLDKVVKKTNVNKNEILKLANDLQSKNLNDENDIRDFIMSVARVTNKTISPSKVEKLVTMIKSNKIPNDINKMM
ncbi:MAG: stage VI sporulation protein F [[Clostridium] spiroforme]|uniref:Stage VI sporulation protein F n=1 Tax=Thomasclavelia spiroformis TaxID=29348 RepID=A0A943I4Q3_9FIRM|nr:MULTISPECIES: stage VI sporulation protein F [Thomasclavelia]MBS5588982.1 stage VI sporulation protein F [Thomasclavelia spiroformis]